MCLSTQTEIILMSFSLNNWMDAWVTRIHNTSSKQTEILAFVSALNTSGKFRKTQESEILKRINTIYKQACEYV